KKRGQELKAGGLDARFLYHVVADEWIGSERPEGAKVGVAHKEYSSRVTDMLDTLHTWTRSGKRDIPSISFGNEAKEELLAIRKVNTKAMAQPEYSYYRDFLAKLTGHIARMAAKNHIFLGREGDIKADLVDNARHICEYHFDVYRFTHDPLDQEPQRVRDAAMLERWMRTGNIPNLKYDEISKIALVLGMTMTNLRGAIGEMFNQNRAFMRKLEGKYLIELLPRPGLLENIVNPRQFSYPSRRKGD
ncbi:DUF3987 domain-containing protein, partial [Pseudomonas aeruginosa]